MIETKLRKELPFTWKTAGRESPGFIAIGVIFDDEEEDCFHDGWLEREITAGLNHMLCVLNDQPANISIDELFAEMVLGLDVHMPNLTFKGCTLGITLQTRQGFEISVDHELSGNSEDEDHEEDDFE